LGLVLQQQGKFAEALAALQQGHQLRSQQPGLTLPTAQWIKQCLFLKQLDDKLTAVRSGQSPPPDTAAGQLGLGVLCGRFKKYHAAAARFYAGALAADPQPPTESVLSHRYNAACSAALAADGQGEDAADLRPEEKTKLRQQALTWLRAELNRLASALPPDPRQTEPGSGLGGLQEKLTQPVTNANALAAAALRTLDRLRVWQADTDLAGVRQETELMRLPADEQSTWRKLWADVDAVRRRAASVFRVTAVDGTLTESQREQAHELKLAAGRIYVFDMHSEKFNAFLRLEDSSGNKVAEAADRGEIVSRDSRIVYRPERAGTYRVISTSVGRFGRGAYALQIRECIAPGGGN
jgi:hypothetical protein